MSFSVAYNFPASMFNSRALYPTLRHTVLHTKKEGKVVMMRVLMYGGMQEAHPPAGRIGGGFGAWLWGPGQARGTHRVQRSHILGFADIMLSLISGRNMCWRLPSGHRKSVPRRIC